MVKLFMRVFEVKFLGPTNYRGSRVRILDLHNNKRKIISYDYESNNVWEMAESYLEKIGIIIKCRGGSDRVDYLLSDNFTIELK